MFFTIVNRQLSIFIPKIFNLQSSIFNCLSGWTVVYMPVASWRRINGEMDATTFPHLLKSLPGPTQFTFREEVLVVIAYNDWKRKMRQWLKRRKYGNQNH